MRFCASEKVLDMDYQNKLRQMGYKGTGKLWLTLPRGVEARGARRTLGLGLAIRHSKKKHRKGRCFSSLLLLRGLRAKGDAPKKLSKLRSPQRSWRKLSPSKKQVSQPRECSLSSTAWTMVGLPEPDRPVNQRTRLCWTSIFPRPLLVILRGRGRCWRISAFTTPIDVFKTDNIILAQVAAGLDFDHPHRDVVGVFQAVG